MKSDIRMSTLALSTITRMRRSERKGVASVTVFTVLMTGVLGCAVNTADEHEEPAPSGSQGEAEAVGVARAAVQTPVRGWVTSDATDPFANRCAVDPIGDLSSRLSVDPPYVLAYSSGRSGCGVWAPTTGDGLEHRQGIQRLNLGGKNYFLVSSSVAAGSFAGFEVVELGSRSSTRAALGQNVIPGGSPPCLDHVVSYMAYPFTSRDHAGGLQSMGRYVAVPLENSNDAATAGFRVADLAIPSSPTWGPTTLRTRGQTANAGAVSLARLGDGTFVALIFGNDSDDVEVFVSSDASIPGFAPNTASWISVAQASTPSGFQAYQNVQFVTKCDGTLYVVGTHKNLSGSDWADLWRVDFSSSYTPSFTKVANRNMKCSTANTGNVRYCDFQAGAGVYVSDAGRLAVYGVEHYNDAVPGTPYGIKVREFF
jgi:hypothetical protein